MNDRQKLPPGPTIEHLLRACFRPLVVIAIASITAAALLIVAALGAENPTDGKTPIHNWKIEEIHNDAAEGNPEAQLTLGNAYRWGLLGVPQDHRAALKWYRSLRGDQRFIREKGQESLALVGALGVGAQEASEPLDLMPTADSNGQGH